jgi:hypothetical protein
VQACLAIGSPIDLPDPETGLHRMTRDYKIIWKETNT